MPAMLDDPTAPAIYRMSGDPPFPGPGSPLPNDVVPRQITLRDRITTATLIPFSSHKDVPPRLLSYLCDQLNLEIEKGDTYPMIDPMPLSSFGPYWFANFGAVMLMGQVDSVERVKQIEAEGKDWAKECLGSFYIKPNYPGRSSHVCNGGFLVTDMSRNKGVGRCMGEAYIEWAPKLGYTYSVFNLVYETNTASRRIWDALGFKVIGRVKGCGNLRSHPDVLIDAIQYGRDLGPEGEDYVSEERFEKIRYYLKNQKYPAGADRAEKSRLRSAATHYKLLPGENGDPERLMLKGKEVISDPQQQYEIAKDIHWNNNHGGINKTTATIAEKYHWVRIKETVSLVIKNCEDCKEANKPIPGSRPKGETSEDTPKSTSRPKAEPLDLPRTDISPVQTPPVMSPTNDALPAGLDTATLQQTNRPQMSQPHTPIPQASPVAGPIQSIHASPIVPHMHPDPQEHYPLPLATMQDYPTYDSSSIDPALMPAQLSSQLMDMDHMNTMEFQQQFAASLSQPMDQQMPHYSPVDGMDTSFSQNINGLHPAYAGHNNTSHPTDAEINDFFQQNGYGLQPQANHYVDMAGTQHDMQTQGDSHMQDSKISSPHNNMHEANSHMDGMNNSQPLGLPNGNMW